MNAKHKQLCHYILPSAGGLCVTYLYNIVDGIFVGRGVGHLALAAVNITVPFITTTVALSSLFAMGGSTVIAIRLGRGDRKGANDAFLLSLFLTLLLSVILLVVGTVFPAPIALDRVFSGTILPLAVDYLFYYTAFSIPFLLSNCLSVFVRNDGAPALAFWGMCAGAVANVFLDWLFIFPLQMGIRGAAIASGLGQVLSFLILLSHFVRKRGQLRLGAFSCSAALLGKICKRGVPECVSQLNTPVTAPVLQLGADAHAGGYGGGDLQRAELSLLFANAILSGVAQGLQPLWGLAFGQKDRAELTRTLAAGLRINLISAAGIYVCCPCAGCRWSRCSNRDPDLVQMASAALPVFALSFLFMAVNLIWTAYFIPPSRRGRPMSSPSAGHRGQGAGDLCRAGAVWQRLCLARGGTGGGNHLLIGLICRRLPASGAARRCCDGPGARV